MNIDEIYDELSLKISQLHVHQRYIQEVTNKEIKNIDSYIDQHKNKSDFEVFSKTMHRMLFRNIETGEQTTFGRIDQSLDDLRTSVVLYKNKQYQWLLSEAYEAFESFVVRFYAYSGCNDRNFWPLTDYGNISMYELESKGYQWYLERSLKKNGRPHSIFKQIRKKLPEIESLEKNNPLGVDLKVSLSLIEMLRHVIVHNGGITNDFDDFVKKTLEKAGVFNDGNYSEENFLLIRSCFGEGVYENMITLLEIPVKNCLPLGLHINVFDYFSGILMGYAYKLTGCARGIV